MLKHCELFGGIGGFSQAIRQWFPDQIQTTAYCDINEDAWTVYKHHFPEVPRYADVRHYNPNPGAFDIITATFPCTGTSDAGKREGLNHPDSALWREALRICFQVQPKFLVVEQPLGVIHRGLRAILGGLRVVRYCSEVGIVRCSELGAGHQRARLFVISYPDQWRDIYRNAPRWECEIGAVVERVRDSSQWLLFERTGDGKDPGIPRGLSKSPFLVPARQPGRIRARYLAGKTVTPPQAAVVLHRIIELHQYGEHHGE